VGAACGLREKIFPCGKREGNPRKWRLLWREKGFRSRKVVAGEQRGGIDALRRRGRDRKKALGLFTKAAVFTGGRGGGGLTISAGRNTGLWLRLLGPDDQTGGGGQYP